MFDIVPYGSPYTVQADDGETIYLNIAAQQHNRVVAQRRRYGWHLKQAASDGNGRIELWFAKRVEEG